MIKIGPARPPRKMFSAWGYILIWFLRADNIKVMFCRVLFSLHRGRVWESHRTSRSIGYRYGSVTELTEVPGIVARAYRTHRSSGPVQRKLYPYFGFCGTGVQI